MTTYIESISVIIQTKENEQYSLVVLLICHFTQVTENLKKTLSALSITNVAAVTDSRVLLADS